MGGVDGGALRPRGKAEVADLSLAGKDPTFLGEDPWVGAVGFVTHGPPRRSSSASSISNNNIR
ncbi:hypothetical protein PAL_GLEAN10006011 [Pteropus alecto]|uniref:Uncharacterized protein n=1 Tax=Pteropus alecto TaxID=9402 RepID=L5L7X0_PTEAL|nr:hypothetical protein PAL_GLEAN10006011 [Pteropus alecto]